MAQLGRKFTTAGLTLVFLFSVVMASMQCRYYSVFESRDTFSDPIEIATVSGEKVVIPQSACAFPLNSDSSPSKDKSGSDSNCTFCFLTGIGTTQVVVDLSTPVITESRRLFWYETTHTSSAFYSSLTARGPPHLS